MFQRNRGGKKETSGPAIERKIVKLPVYHFYQNKDRLTELLTREYDYKYEVAVRKNPEQEISVEPLTEAEVEKKNELLASGFSNWTRADYFAFLRGSEKFGRSNYASIAEIVGKTEREVKEYAIVFWERIDELPEHEKIIKNIERGEAVIKEEEESMRLLKAKCQDSQYYDDLVFDAATYSKFKSKVYSEEHDKFLAFHTAKAGMGRWNGLKLAIEHESAFEFDPYIRSRAEVDLGKRLNQVVKFLKAEEEQLQVRLKAEKEKEKLAAKRDKAVQKKKRESSKARKTEKDSKKTKKRASDSKSRSKSVKKTSSSQKRDKSAPSKKKAASKSKEPTSRSTSSKAKEANLKKRVPSKQQQKPGKKMRK